MHHMCISTDKHAYKHDLLPFCFASVSCKGAQYSALSAEFTMSSVQVFLMQYRRFGVVAVPQQAQLKNAAEHMVPSLSSSAVQSNY